MSRAPLHWEQRPRRTGMLLGACASFPRAPGFPLTQQSEVEGVLGLSPFLLLRALFKTMSWDRSGTGAPALCPRSKSPWQNVAGSGGVYNASRQKPVLASRILQGLRWGGLMEGYNKTWTPPCCLVLARVSAKTKATLNPKPSQCNHCPPLHSLTPPPPHLKRKKT